MRIKSALRIFNPIIFLWNFFKYSAHLDSYQNSKEYVPYDFNKHDTKYFE